LASMTCTGDATSFSTADGGASKSSANYKLEISLAIQWTPASTTIPTHKSRILIKNRNRKFYFETKKLISNHGT
jgi:hypothetical protein